MKADLKSWWQAPITFWAAFFALFLLTPSHSYARQEFALGDNVRVLSDKAFRKSRNNLYEAVGNVIITQGNNSIYGEKATLSFTTGDVNVVGNVRYVGPEMTMYGSRLTYNLNTKLLSVNNGRVLSDNYVILGNTLSRVGPNELYGKDAEYTTCRDCPESWSIFGREVKITMGEYIRIRHAYIKAKGVVVMYFPYIILPIKKERQTGLLFPSFGININEGVRFQQPFFWNISPHADATITPSFFGDRGLGSELEFRHTPFDGFEYQTRGLFSNDTIYLPGKSDHEKIDEGHLRYLGQWEHHYFSGENITHHTNFTKLRDFDFARDYQFYTDDKVMSSDSGLETFFDFRNDYFNVDVFSGYRTNHLYEQPRDFDNRYVQILPQISFDVTPVTLLETEVPLLKRFSFSLESDYTVFKQNHFEEGEFIRNANRLNFVPSLLWNFGQLGPIYAQTKVDFDYQDYRFNHLDEKNNFSKYGIVNETEISLTLDKIFGLAFTETVPKEMKSENNRTTQPSDSKLIGQLPSLSNVENENYQIVSNSYRHRQEFKLKHYFLSNQSYRGNADFYDQIRDDNGRFDTVDTIRSKEFEAQNETSKTTLPINNTLELQWNNSITRKSARSGDLLSDGRKVRNNFDYNKISYFNISQGFDFYRTHDENGNELDFSERLTRLLVETGVTFKTTTFSLQEYFYHATQEHISRAAMTTSFDIGSLTTSLRYNSFRVPVDKFFAVSGTLDLSDMLSLNGLWEYDIEQSQSYRTIYGLTYRPSNDCWLLQLDYTKTIAQVSVGFNFAIKFNDAMFGMGGGQ